MISIAPITAPNALWPGRQLIQLAGDLPHLRIGQGRDPRHRLGRVDPERHDLLAHLRAAEKCQHPLAVGRRRRSRR